MSEYTKQIRRVTEERAGTHERVDEVLRDLGTRAVELPPDQQISGLEIQLREYGEIQEGLRLANSAIERMLDIDTRENEIRQTMKNLGTEREDLGRGLSGVYEQIGAVAFRLYRESPLVDAGYSSAFEALARYQDEVRSIESKLNQLTQSSEHGQKPGILDRIRISGKDAYLRNRRNARENRLPRLLQETGEQLAAGDFITQVDDEELTRVSEPLRQVHRRWEEIDQETRELAHESGRLVEEFNDLSGGRGLRRARSERESDITRLREQLDNILVQIGMKTEEERPEHFSEVLGNLDKLRRIIAEKDALLARLNAGLQAETVAREIAVSRKQQEKIQSEIKEQQAYLVKLREEQSTLEAQLQQLESERGDPSELLGR